MLKSIKYFLQKTNKKTFSQARRTIINLFIFNLFFNIFKVIFIPKRVPLYLSYNIVFDIIQLEIEDISLTRIYILLIQKINMWTQVLNQSRSERKFGNRSLIILGAKHSGKRSLVDSLFDIAKTTLYNKKQAGQNKMRLRGTTTAIDYAYLNVIDIQDPDNRTHAKLEVYMIEQVQSPSIYQELANPNILKNSVFVIMLDFTNPWNFIVELEKWIKFIYELQKMAQMTIGGLEEAANNLISYYKKFRQPEFDQNGKLKVRMNYDHDQQELSLPLPEGVLTHNIRVPLVICVNKCDLQNQVLRQESSTKILLILYHLRKFCVQYGSSLIYTSIRNNSNLGIFYQYILHHAYQFPLRFRPELVNQQAIFIPFGYDKPSLINDSVVKIDVSKSFNEIIPQPVAKRQIKEEVLVQDDPKFFQKYINQSQASNSTASNQTSQREVTQQPFERKKEEVTDFFKNLLTGGANTKKQTILGVRTNLDQSQRLLNAEKELLKHTAQVLQKKNLETQ